MKSGRHLLIFKSQHRQALETTGGMQKKRKFRETWTALKEKKELKGVVKWKGRVRKTWGVWKMIEEWEDMEKKPKRKTVTRIWIKFGGFSRSSLNEECLALVLQREFDQVTKAVLYCKTCWYQLFMKAGVYIICLLLISFFGSRDVVFCQNETVVWEMKLDWLCQD